MANNYHIKQLKSLVPIESKFTHTHTKKKLKKHREHKFQNQDKLISHVSHKHQSHNENNQASTPTKQT